MDPKIRAEIWLIILAFGIVFIWGALFSVTTLSPPSFSSQGLQATSESFGAPAFAVGTSTFIFFTIIGIVLILGFIIVVLKSAADRR